MGNAAIGSQAKFAVDSVLPFDTSSKAFEIVLPETLRKSETFRETGGLRGTRSHHDSRVRRETSQVSGNIQMHPGVAELDWLLPYILGGSTTAGVTPLAETVGSFQAMIDRVTKVFTYTDLSVAVARLSGSTGSPVVLALDLEGLTETVGNAGTFPAITIPDEQQFIFPDTSVVIGGVTYPIKSFTLTIDNKLKTDRFMNSATRTSVPATDRMITLSLQLGYTTTEVALYDLAIAGATASLVLNDGTTSYTFAFANVKAPSSSPTVQSKDEIDLNLSLTAYRTDSTNTLIVTKA